jgi:hypothetical protein
MDEYITTARHMLGFGSSLEEIRDALYDKGAAGFEAMHAYYAAVILNIFGVTYLPWFNRILFSINNFSFTGNLLVACAVLCVAYSAQGKGK